MRCTCTHRAINHRYDTTARANTGECLVGGCGCAGESGGNPRAVRDLSVAGRYDRGLTKDGPGRCANTVIPGPRRTGLERD